MTPPDEGADLEPALRALYELLAPRYAPNENGLDTLRHLYLVRREDKSGVSGVGKVAEVFVFETGVAIVVWLVEPHGINIYDSIKHLKQVHGHEGATELVPADDETAIPMKQRIARDRGRK